MRSSPSEPVARRLSAIAGFYRYATDEDLIDRSPVAGVRRPKVADDSQTTGRDRGPLFITGGGRRYDEPAEPAAFRLVRRLARAAGLDCAERLSPHSLRHAFVTLALDAGVSLRDVQDAAGHADPPHHPALRPGPAQPRPGSHLCRCGVPRRGWSVGSVSRRDAAARRARRTTPRTPESAA